jgi:hypothetical protein
MNKKPTKRSPPKKPAPAPKKPAPAKKSRPAAKRSPGGKTPLPVALARRSKAAHVAKMKRLAARARAIVAHIRECQADAAANMVDIGLALVELKAEGMAEALGRASFAEVCAEDLKMSASTVNTLIAIATRVPRELATRVGADRARALLDLTDATPEGDTPEAIESAQIRLPSGHTLNVAEASNVELRAAAKELRAARPEATRKRGRGFSTRPEEKSEFAALIEGLSAQGKLIFPSLNSCSCLRAGRGSHTRDQPPRGTASWARRLECSSPVATA